MGLRDEIVPCLDPGDNLSDRAALPSRRAAIYLAAAAILGSFLLLYFMRTGIGIRGDSVRYVMGARNLLGGNGFSRTSGGGEIFPETGFAPLLSVVLAGMGALKIELYQGTRILNAVLFGLNGFLVGWLIWRFSRSVIAAMVGSLLFLLAPSIVEWHGWLMSEALFIFLTLLSVLTLLRFLDTGRSGLWVLAGVLAGTACLARYIGLSMAPAGALAILSLRRAGLRTRLPQAAAFALLAVMPFTLWMIRNQVVGGAGLANREILFHAIRPDLLRQYLFEVATWALPESIHAPRGLRALIALAVLGIGPATYFVWAWRHRRRPMGEGSTTRGTLPTFSFFFLVSYVAVLIVNSFLLDAGTGTSAAVRYLTPFFAILVPFEVSSYHALVLHWGGPRWRGTILAGAGVLLIVLFSFPTWALIQGSTWNLGFTGIRERWATAAAELLSLADGHPIIANNPEVNYYLIDRPAYIMPIKYDAYRLQARDDFPQQLELARQRLLSGSVLVVFQEPKPDEVEVLGLLGVVPLRTFPDVVIYGYPDRSAFLRIAFLEIPAVWPWSRLH